MKLLHFTPLFFFLLLQLLAFTRARPDHSCSIPDNKGSSTLKVFHVSSPCSPFKPKKMSWEESVIQMFIEDKARSQYLSSLVARKSIAPVAWARQLIQSPTYIVRVNVGTPAQTFLMALDTSNDVAWLPCNGCVGCGTSLFSSEKSTSFKAVSCGSQCQQVHFLFDLCLISFHFNFFILFIFIFNEFCCYLRSLSYFLRPDLLHLLYVVIRLFTIS